MYRHTLSAEEKKNLETALKASETTVVEIHGSGQFREVSFYAAGTRMAAHMPCTDAPEE